MDKVINDIAGMYPDIHIDTYVIMPNHIHLIVAIDPSIQPNDVQASFEHGTLIHCVGSGAVPYQFVSHQ